MGDYTRYIIDENYTRLQEKSSLDNNSYFIAFLREMLKKGNLKEEWINLILSNKENINIYKDAFTNKSSDQKNNYELYELLGDKIVNACVMEYIYKSFPEYRSAESVSFFSKIIAKYCSKSEFSKLGKITGFHKFIVASEDNHERNRDKMSEDVFESFFGATNLIINKDIRQGVGYAIIYDIIENIFKTNVKIDTRFTKLVDEKTILKELFDSKEYKLMFGIPTTGTGNDLKYLIDDLKSKSSKFTIHIVHPISIVLKQTEYNELQFILPDNKSVQYVRDYLEGDINVQLINMKYNELLRNIFPKGFPIDIYPYLDKDIIGTSYNSPSTGFNTYRFEVGIYVLLSTGTGNNKIQASIDAAGKLLSKLEKYRLYNPEMLNNKYDRKYKGLSD